MFRFTKLKIPEVIIIETDKFPDPRGLFFEHYKESEFVANGIAERFSQDSFSISKKNVLRGMHYQKDPIPQGKLVNVLSGSIFDVAVDIRKGSPNFGKWVSAELSAENRKSIWVPPGFAHGFLALEDNTMLLYKTTNEYAPQEERGIIWNDPDLKIKWPLEKPILSDKDGKRPRLKDADINFVYR